VPVAHRFPCENPALDFVGTLRARRDASPTEMLTSPDSLADWFRGAGVAPDVTCRPRDVDRATALREAIYSLVTARLAHEPFDEDALAHVNRAASRPPAVPRLTVDGRVVAATPEQALSSVARIAIEVLGGTDPLKECGRPECTQVYLDRSRGGRRAWCAMETCGNKVKAAAYRARKRGNLPRAG
jgi:predicted RNA-binding Zn ribbon-like protein